MKWILWLLLLANGLLLAYFNLPMQSEVDLQITETPLSPEKIKLLSQQEIETLPKRQPVSSLPAEPVVQFGCYEWGTFSRAKLASARNFLSRFSLDVTATQQTSEESRRYWVYIPSLRNAAAAQSKVEELRALGVEEMYVVQDQQSRNAISLGVFKDEQLATKLLEDLKSKGVVSAVKGVRNQENGRASLYISNMSSELVSEIDKLQPDYPGSELKQVTCQ
ncbi:MAG: SPOR domain-containing protein [Nitrosomonadales bacterium]|nr:SPOR domain-containing protein [Nitrosomonadales bacterium]